MPKLKGDTGEEEDTEVAVGGGTFTQDAVNSIVRDRISQVKAVLEAKYQTQITAYEDAKKQIEELTKKAEKYDALFKTGLDERRKKLPESVVKLLDKLDPAEQVEWLDANEASIAPVTTEAGPQTPKPKALSPDAQTAQEAKRNSGNYNL